MRIIVALIAFDGLDSIDNLLIILYSHALSIHT
jgi:hypothetical protein